MNERKNGGDYENISRKNRIIEIYNYLIENINSENIKEKINEIEEILYED